MAIKISKLFSYDVVSGPGFYDAKFEKLSDIEREAKRKKLKNDRTEKLNRLNNL